MPNFLFWPVFFAFYFYQFECNLLRVLLVFWWNHLFLYILGMPNHAASIQLCVQKLRYFSFCSYCLVSFSTKLARGGGDMSYTRFKMRSRKSLLLVLISRFQCGTIGSRTSNLASSETMSTICVHSFSIILIDRSEASSPSEVFFVNFHQRFHA